MTPEFLSLREIIQHKNNSKPVQTVIEIKKPNHFQNRMEMNLHKWTPNNESSNMAKLSVEGKHPYQQLSSPDTRKDETEEGTSNCPREEESFYSVVSRNSDHSLESSGFYIAQPIEQTTLKTFENHSKKGSIEEVYTRYYNRTVPMEYIEISESMRQANVNRNSGENIELNPIYNTRQRDVNTVETIDSKWHSFLSCCFEQ